MHSNISHVGHLILVREGIKQVNSDFVKINSHRFYCVNELSYCPNKPRNLHTYRRAVRVSVPWLNDYIYYAWGWGRELGKSWVCNMRTLLLVMTVTFWYLVKTNGLLTRFLFYFKFIPITNKLHTERMAFKKNSAISILKIDWVNAIFLCRKEFFEIITWMKFELKIAIDRSILKILRSGFLLTSLFW